ncbi:hypothetical protein M9458_032741, partial [Cirrhinus mrigala]
MARQSWDSSGSTSVSRRSASVHGLPNLHLHLDPLSFRIHWIPPFLQFLACSTVHLRARSGPKLDRSVVCGSSSHQALPSSGFPFILARSIVHPRASIKPELDRSMLCGCSFQPPPSPHPRTIVIFNVQIFRYSSTMQRPSSSNVPVWVPGPISSAFFGQFLGSIGPTGVMQLLGSSLTDSFMRFYNFASGFQFIVSAP